MRNFASILFSSLLLLIISCTINDGSKQPLQVSNDSVVAIVHNNRTAGIDSNSNLLIALPGIVPLPFGPKINPGNLNQYSGPFYSSLLVHGPNSSDGDSAAIKGYYKLPSIHKVNYIDIDSTWREFNCKELFKNACLLFFNKYTHRLPDIGSYQCYYLTGYNYDDIPQAVSDFCNQFYLHHYLSWGYLILYDPVIKEASVIQIYYDTGRDGCSVTRKFLIDAHYSIYLVDQGYCDSDDPFNPGSRRQINISKKGEITVTKTEN